MDIQQGNYLEGKSVDQLQVGMTRTQVRYLLGTPLVPDCFDKDRWDYLYYFRHGRLPPPGRSAAWWCTSRRTRWRASSAKTCPSARRWRPMRARPISKFPKI